MNQLSLVLVIVSLFQLIDLSLCASEEKQETADYEASLEETTEVAGTDPGTDERFHHHHHHHNHHPLHLFMKKKRPFVSFSTKTETSTLTSITSLSTIGLCAKLVNVTGSCRHRRGLWVEDPIVMSFDDDMDAIDEALLPTATLRIEPTAMPDMTKGRMLDDKYISSSVIQSSTTSSPDQQEEEDEEEEPVGQRIGFKKIFGLKNVFKKKIKLHLITVVTTTISTVTSTSTSYITISTKTFFIQLCTPSPFPFKICDSRRKRRRAELELIESKRIT